MSDTLPVLHARPHPLSLGVAERDDPPPSLEPESFAERLYVALAPVARLDPEYGWALLIYCNALGTMFQLLEDWERDTPDGPGWSVLMDLERCPDEALPWLAQFAGVRSLTGLSPAEQRAQIASTGGFKRGTADAMIAAAQATLTDIKRVVLRERDHDPADTPNYAYYLTVRTVTSQTPDAAVTLAALLAQKPGGIVMDYATISGQDYATVKTRFATYQAVKDAYPNYIALGTDEP